MRTTLPRLAFGERRVFSQHGVDGLLAAQRLAHRAIRCYEPIGRPAAFSQKSVAVTIGDLTLVASSHTAVRVAVDASDDLTLMVPLRGWSTAVIEGREYRWLAGRSGMFLPGVPREGESGARSTLAIRMERARLEQAAMAISLRVDHAGMRALLSAPRLVPLVVGGFSFSSVLRRICGLIDVMLDEPARLSMLGVDEMIYRAVATLLLPEGSISPDAVAGVGTGRQSLDRACDYIRGHLFEPLRLADLEVASGIKARALQLAFVEHLGCSPRQWIRERRLDAAREQLLAADAMQTITSVALACRFAKLSTFSAAYVARFGESPRATLARCREGEKGRARG